MKTEIRNISNANYFSFYSEISIEYNPPTEGVRHFLKNPFLKSKNVGPKWNVWRET